MLVLLSGEGVSDIGSSAGGSPPVASGDHFLPGPMAKLIDQLLEYEGQIGYSPIDCHSCHFVGKSHLKDIQAGLKSLRKGRPFLPGKKRAKETGLFYTNARSLAVVACDLASKLNSPVLAVLFRDLDSTNSSKSTEWDEKRSSMKNGFAAEACSFEEPKVRFVAMIPKPKSEAWLICALLNNSNRCADLEARSGNDASPRDLKSELETLLGNLGNESHHEHVYRLISERSIDYLRIQMPSFDIFKAELLQASKEIMGFPAPVGSPNSLSKYSRMK